ncbi:1-acyl-sn-glycerol-3-phosphate acyltransferase [Antarcticibacterium sp. 1MA-6-2]|uniref:1-acyl-sn-glycerol-3-phosphate acyltransferase n=1 Tax=Antarcticibacterium sp. 1MA-6-2 TaxID=2908210 RepID=UPI001F186B13|nr:1-acyl-sn-glycerol-3-phosphate acyltransferase [Antarcticibacterium sp. 1MA-6-2]UJH90505.1 1-acyl-sn-glycerol-3-phosphate acyltransferase [Antarcticibacterium sp. 1MA-6-2]
MSRFEDIRFYNEEEVQPALKKYVHHPMIKALLQFTFPENSYSEIEAIAAQCHSIRDFQTKIIYKTVQRVLEKSSEGLTYSGFDQLKKDESYLYISNHRDIILDTCLLNYLLYEQDLIMTASAIGDNLVQKPFLLMLSRINRNFLVQRGLSPRTMLQSSQNLSEYIKHLLFEENRSVWMAQREGRTKDGNDTTQQGVLKMLAMAKGEMSLSEYFSKIKIVPVSISYEFDPTDIMKMPEIMAKRMEETYVKSANEDFKSIMKGALGNKGRIHIEAGKVFTKEWFEPVVKQESSVNDFLKTITLNIDKEIHSNYKLWPSNYIACDLLLNNDSHSSKYTQKEKRQFERRLTRRINCENSLEVNSYLLMYANPVINKEALNEGKI